MNEVSNGPSGNQEYVEFVVVSNSVAYNCGNTTPPCIDIRGWIFDDNSGYHGSGGVASGAVRFSQNPLWSCVPLGTIILIYNNLDRNPAIPPDDLSLSDGNCTIVAPISNTSLFESNATTPGASACSYPATGWTAGGNWNNTLLANPGDCARIVNLSGCEVFSVCWGTDNLNNLIYFSGSGSQTVWYFNGNNPAVQSNWSGGSASPSPGNQTPGAPNNATNAAYIAQFNNGCQPITPLQVTATTINAGCTCNGSATANATGSIGGYTYVWYDSAFNPIGQTNATATGLCPGVYHVIAKSHIGCTDTTSVTITSTSSTSVAVSSGTICGGNSAVLTATPSAAGGTYLWSPGGQTASSISVNPSSSTSYSVTYTLAGCAATATTNVTVSSNPTISIGSLGICAGQTATLTANGAVTYTWNTGSNSNPLIVSPGSTTNYTVTGTSAAGCTNSSLGTVTVNPSPTVTVNSSTICAGQTATLTANGASSYIWDNGSTVNPLIISPSVGTSYTVTGMTAGCTNTAVSTVSVISSPSLTISSLTICTGQTATLTANGADTYTWSTGPSSGSLIVSPSTTTTYSVTGTLSGCFGSGTATVHVIPQPTVSINTPTICVGETATLTATGATSYTWSSGSTLNPFTASPASNSTYTVTGDNGGCTNTATTVVTVNPLPTITVNSPTICLGQTATLTANGATSYSWSNGSASPSVSVSPTVTTTYSVAGTLSGCTSTATAGVIVNSVSLTVSSAGVCAGQAATLVANGATTYTWDNGSTTNSITVSPLVNSTYTVTGSAGSCTNSAVASVTINPTPTITVNSPTICAGQTATLTANGGSGYTWNTGSGNASINVSPMATTGYSVTGTQAGCSGLATTTVVVLSSPTITVNSASICAGQATTLIAGGATSYTWNTGSTSHSITASPAVNTTYTVTGTMAGCSSGAVGTISVTPLPPVTVSSSSICIGQTATLTANGAATYSWNNGASSGTINVSPATTSTYAVTGTINNCSAVQTGTVYVSPMPVINFSASKTSGCAPLCVNFSDLTTISGGSISNWQWSLGDGGTSVLANPNYCYTNAGSYTVGLTVTTSGGCSVSLSNNNMITVFETPVAEFTSDFQGNDSFDPTVQFTNLSTNASSYYWSFGDSYASTETNPLHPFVQAGVYSTTLTATSSPHNCKATVVHEISVKGLFTFYAPNAFTPNNDMVNDVFLPAGTGWDTSTYQLLIFDRWGNLCFSTHDPLMGWNGKAKNGSEIAQIDTYTWKVQVSDIYGESHKFIGRVTILK